MRRGESPTENGLAGLWLRVLLTFSLIQLAARISSISLCLSFTRYPTPSNTRNVTAQASKETTKMEGWCRAVVPTNSRERDHMDDDIYMNYRPRWGPCACARGGRRVMRDPSRDVEVYRGIRGA